MDEGKIFPKGGNILPKSTPHDGGESQPKIFLGGDILDSSPPPAPMYEHEKNEWTDCHQNQFGITLTSYHPYPKIKLFLEFEMDVHKKSDFSSMISPEVVTYLNQEKNFNINCNGQTFQFNKTLLGLTSEVFFKMIQGYETKESQSNSVEINDFSPETIKSFQNIVFGDEKAKMGDFTPELLLFGQKYLVKSLIATCSKHLIRTVCKENIFEVIKISHLIDDENLLKRAAEFLKTNIEKMSKSEKWKNFEKSHPDCMVRIYRLMFAEN